MVALKVPGAPRGRIAASAQSPVDAALGRAQACLAGGDTRQAVEIMQAAVRIAPENAAVCAGLGVALRFAGQLEEAANAFSRALQLQPERADAQVYLGMIRLAQGRQQEGWPLYRARWRDANWTAKLRYPESALWEGRVTSGLRLLLWGEQGFGDTIQFSRYVPWLQRELSSRGASLALEVPVPLLALLRQSWPAVEIFSIGETRGRFDAHLPLMDLPSRCGNAVGAGALPYQPMALPYLAALPDPLAAQRGASPIPAGNDRAPLRVGIAWRGRASHPDDRWRSIRASELQTLFAVPGIRWVSLQKGDADGHPVWLPEDLAQCADFADTARIVASLDLVISIDSAVAHLAGALNKRVWLLLPKVADWRWQLAGEDTPWYPDMRLFRQAADEDWPQVATRVAAQLTSLTARRRQTDPLGKAAS